MRVLRWGLLGPESLQTYLGLTCVPVEPGSSWRLHAPVSDPAHNGNRNPSRHAAKEKGLRVGLAAQQR